MEKSSPTHNTSYNITSAAYDIQAADDFIN